MRAPGPSPSSARPRSTRQFVPVGRVYFYPRRARSFTCHRVPRRRGLPPNLSRTVIHRRPTPFRPLARSAVRLYRYAYIHIPCICIYALCPSRSPFVVYSVSPLAPDGLPRHDKGRKIRRLETSNSAVSWRDEASGSVVERPSLSHSRMLPFSLLHGGRSCHRVFSGADVRHSHVWVGPSQRERRRGHLNPRRRKEGGTKERRKEAGAGVCEGKRDQCHERARIDAQSRLTATRKKRGRRGGDERR